jgi:hypothetical protein
VWKKVLLSILVLVVLAVAGLVVFVVTYRPAQRRAPDLRVELTPERVEHGRYLVSHVLGCGDCHSDRDWGLYGMSDEDLSAIWAYLQTVPPVENRVERRPQVAAAP